VRIGRNVQTTGENLAEVKPVNLEPEQLVSIREQNAGENDSRWSQVEGDGRLVEKRAHAGNSTIQEWESSVQTEACKAVLEVRR